MACEVVPLRNDVRPPALGPPDRNTAPTSNLAQQGPPLTLIELSGSAGARIAEGRRDASLIGSLPAWIEQAGLRSEDFLVAGRIHDSARLGTRQYARILEGWAKNWVSTRGAYGTHSIRRTKPTMIYLRTKNLRAVQLMLGYTQLESTVRYPGIEVDDAWIFRSKRGFDARGHRGPSPARSSPS